MKYDKIQVIGGLTIITILIIMLIYIFGGEIYTHLRKDEKETSLINVKYDELYPFENSKKDIESKNMMEKYKEVISKLKSKIEKATSESLVGYEKFVECSYIYNDIISYKLVSNSSPTERIELENGYFSRIVKKENIDEASNRLLEFNEYLNNLKIHLLYIQEPYKISEQQEISSIYKDYSNENMNNFLSSIDGKIDYIDLRKNINENKLNHLKLFYKTDHHWLPETRIIDDIGNLKLFK